MQDGQNWGQADRMGHIRWEGSHEQGPGGEGGQWNRELLPGRWCPCGLAPPKNSAVSKLRWGRPWTCKSKAGLAFWRLCKEKTREDFPCGPVINAWGTAVLSGREAKIPHAAWCDQKKKKNRPQNTENVSWLLNRQRNSKWLPDGSWCLQSSKGL